MDQIKARLSPNFWNTTDAAGTYAQFNRTEMNSKSRKRTKTGCLTCRKRRVKCGEERPTCSNCVKSRRQCEGYIQRTIFKPSLSDWRDHLSTVDNNINNPYLSSTYETGNDVTFTLPHYALHLQDHDSVEVEPSAVHKISASPIGPPAWYPREQLPATPFPQDIVEYLDNDYFDLESDDDSAICLSEDSTCPKTGTYAIKWRLAQLRMQAYLSFTGALDQYRPQHTANPIKDPYVAKVFAHFVEKTAPTLATFCIDAYDDLWTRSIPELALHDLGLLHSVLALSTLQISHSCHYSTTPSLKHYAYALKRVRRDLAQDVKRVNLNTIATTVLLGLYDFISGTLSSWTTYLRLAVDALVSIEPTRKRMDQNSYPHEHEGRGGCQNEFCTPLPCNKQNSQKLNDVYLQLYWACAKQDVFRCILDGGDLMINYDTQKYYWPLATVNVSALWHVKFEKFIQILVPIAKLSSRARRNATWASSKARENWTPSAHNKGIGQESTRWTEECQVCEDLEEYLSNALKAMPSSSSNFDSPFGPSIAFSRLEDFNVKASIHMSRILLKRNHPQTLGGVIRAAQSTRKETHEDALAIGRVISGINLRIDDAINCPEMLGTCIECIFPLFFASLQYIEYEQRAWTVNILQTIATITGWPIVTMVSVGVQNSWKIMGHMGQGPPWVEVVSSDPQSMSFGGDPLTGLDLKLPTQWSPTLTQSSGEHDASKEAIRTRVNKDESARRSQALESIQTETTSEKKDEMLVEDEVPEKMCASKSTATSPDSNVSDSDASPISEDDEPLVAAQRRRVVEHVMEYFHSIFRAMPSYRSRGQDSNTQRPCREDHDTFNDAGTSNIVINSSSAARQEKRARKMNDESKDEEEGNPPKRPKKGKEAAESGQRKRKFACPYFKRNSEKYLSKRSCVGPGWDEVRRVKEHLYRNHALPIFCPRCYEVFKLEVMLRDHQRAETPCSRRPEEVIEGFDKPQEKRLRSRKKIQPEPNEEDKWREMYKILFPADDVTMMPSPYLDFDWEKVYQERDVSSGSELARYEQFLRRELPPAVRQELEKAVEKEFSPLEERLKGQLIEIVRDLQLRLFQSYTESRQPVAASDTPAAQAFVESEIPSLEDETISFDGANPPYLPEQHPLQGTGTLENELASFEPPPPLEDSDSFNPILFQLDQLDGFVDYDDSAYSSMFGDYPDWASIKSVGKQDEHRFSVENDNGEGSSGTR